MADTEWSFADAPTTTKSADDWSFADQPSTAKPAEQTLKPGPEPGFWERLKSSIVGSPRSGDTPIGRALGYSFEAPSDKHVPTTELPVVRATELAPDISAVAGAVPFAGPVLKAAAETQVGKGVGEGLSQVGESLTTAPNLLMAAGSEGFGLLAQVNKLLPRVVSGAFSLNMLHQAYDQIPAFRTAWDSNNPEEVARVVTEMAATLGMGVAAGTHATVGAGRDIAAGIEAHNVEASRLMEQERAQPTPITEAPEFVLGAEKIPIAINGENLEIRPAGMSGQRRPYYDIVNPETGEVKFAGYGTSVQDWLRSRGAAANPAQPPPIEERTEAPATAEKPTAPDGWSFAEQEVSPSEQPAGTSFQRGDDKFTIRKAENGKVQFDFEGPAGTYTKSLPKATFDKMLAGVQVGQADNKEVAPAPQKGGGPAQQPSAPEAAGAGEVPNVQGEDRGGEQSPEVRPSEGTPAGPVNLPAGNGPGSVRGLPPEGAGEPSGTEPKPTAGDQGEPGGVRRVTGSADIPITAEGEKQASELAKKATKPFDYVISGSDQRFLDTAKEFTEEPASEPALNGWGRGEHEGKPTDEVKAEVGNLMLNPDQKPPGVSPISGEAGQTFNEFKTPILSEVKKTKEDLGDKDRGLMVTSGGGLQLIDAWAKAGTPEDFKFDHAEMAKQPYWSATGQMFRLGEKGLEKVENNDAPGLYFVEHGATSFNPPKSAEKSTVDNKPEDDGWSLAGPVEPVGDDKISVTQGAGRETLGMIPLDVRRPGLEPMNDIKRNPTGWLQLPLPNGVALVHPTEDKAIRFEAKNTKSGTDVQRAKALAQSYAIDNRITETPAAPEPSGTGLWPTKKAPESTQPQFKEGDRVHWTSARGQKLSGQITGIDTEEGTASINTDQVAMIGGRIKVGRIETVPLTRLQGAEPKPETEPAKKEAAGASGLADAVYKKLSAGESLGNVTELNKLAEEHFGSSRTSGEWTPKDAFDAMEAGINKHLLDVGKDLMGKPAEEGLKELRELMGRVTSQGTRTEEQDKFQQFSTPPTESYVVAKVAGLKPSDVVLEPSAGNGGIAVWPKSIGATTYVNEISDRRREMLELAGFPKPTAHDGEIINSLLDQSIKPTVILMNPPFSAGGAKSGPAKNNNQYGFNHVDSALQRLAPGGRLVAILGGGRADDANGGATLLGGPSGKWFNDLAKRYNVRANIRVHGKEYQKYGTAFATRIIVIDKDGPTPSRVATNPSWESTVRGNADTLEEAYTLLRDVAESRPAIAETAPGTPGAVRPGKGKPATPKGGGAGRARGGTGRQLTGGTGTPGPSGPGGELQPGRTSTGGEEQRPADTGERTSGGESRPGTERPPEETTPGSVQGGPINAPEQRPLTRQELIDRAKQKFAESRGTPKKAEVPKPPKLAAAKKAADEAAARMRARMAKKAIDEEPVRYSIVDGQRVPRDVDPDDLIDLAAIGAGHIVDGATTYPEFVDKMTAAVGDMLDFAAANASLPVDDVLRQVYDLASAVAEDYGAKAEPAPSNVPEDTPALTGNEENVPLTLEQNMLHESDKEDSDAYVEYKPSIKGPQHPGSIVETKTMSTVPLPPITYKPHLPQSVMDKGTISAVQMEAIALAGQQNSTVLPDGSRSMLLIGDGTGVGKGREAAGILWDNFRQGRKRLVWMSQNWDLMQDAMRDLEGVGASEMVQGNTKNANGQYITTGTSFVQPMNKFKPDAKIKHEGLIYVTHALARSADKKGNRRITQLEDFLRGDDNGEGAYIIIDEAHNLKNAVVSGRAQPSQQGKAVKELLGKIPGLRVTALSATAATEVMNLGWMDRLGLWGPGTAFPSGFNEFAGQIAGGRLAAMELIATELKAQGKYLSRTLSFKGVQYDEEEHEVTDEQKAIYRTAAKAWAKVFEAANKTIATSTNGGSKQKANFNQAAGGAQQRFFGTLITALKTPTAIELANKALSEGKSVVITMVNTGEAAQEREKNRVAAGRTGDEEEDDIPEYDFGPKQMLIDLVRENYPVQQYKDDVDDNGNPIKVPVTTIDESGREIPVENPQAIAERDELIKEIDRDLHMPDNPLDILINSLGGGSNVAELTGRKERFDSSTGKFVPRGGPDVARKNINISEMRNFQSGKKRVAVLTGAANAGISLHSSLDAPNQQQRYHITLQVGWSADKAMQMMGRTHRTNQAHPPQYVMLVSDLGGEKRFISTISRRLGSLGALTKGQKNATSGTDLMDKVNFETVEGRAAATAFYEQLLRNEPVPGTGLTGKQVLTDLRMLTGTPPTVRPADRPNVTKLLNRLMALDPDVQNNAYNYFYDIFQATVQRAIEAGTLDTGVKTLPGDSFEVKEQRVIAKDPKTGAQTLYYPVDAKIRNNRVSVKDLEKRIRDHDDEHPNILVKKDGKLILVIDADPIVHASGSIEEAVYVSTPSRGQWVKAGKNRTEYSHTPIDEWAKDKLEKAERELQSVNYSIENARRDVSSPYGGTWATARLANAEKELPEKQAAVDEAKAISEDPMKWAKEEWGRQYEDSPSHTTEPYHLIGRAVMGYWNAISDASHFADIFTTSDSKTGQRVVGVSIPADAINQLLARITGGGTTVNAHQLIVDTLQNGLSYTLEGGIQVRRTRVAGSNVIQMVPPNPNVAQNLQAMGLVYERGVVPVYYVPNAKRDTVVAQVLDQYPVQPDQEVSLSREVPGFFGQGAQRSEYRHGILWVGSQTMKEIQRAQGIDESVGVGGMYVPPSRALRLKNTITGGALGEAISDALQNKQSIVIVRHDAGTPITQSITLARHELFHATEQWGGNNIRGQAIWGDPLAQKAIAGLKAMGYRTDMYSLIFSEIGAHLASGPKGWDDLGLNRDEARQLFRKYLDLLDQEQVNQLDRIAPQLKQELYAARAARAADLGQTGSGPGQGTQESTAGEPVRQSIRRDVPRIGLREEKRGERGSLDLSDLTRALRDRFGEEGPKANYTGLGALKTRFVPGGGLSQLEEASKRAHTAAIRAASDRAQAMVILRQAVPQMKRALEGGDVSLPEMSLAMIESRLRGLRDRWENFATQAEEMSDEDIEKSYNEAFSGLLGAIAGKKDLPQDLEQTAAALVQVKDWEGLRNFLATTFREAAESVTTAMPKEWFDITTEDPHFQKALAVYKDLVEKPLAENHSINEGIFSDALGPLDTYYPLIGVERDITHGPGRRLPYHKPKNSANKFATGLSEGYDAGVEALRDRIAAAVRANDKAALIETLKEQGLLRPMGNGPMPESFKYKGEEYEPHRVEMSPGRIIVQGSKITPTAASYGVMPKWAWQELRPILEREPLNATTALDKFLQVVNTITLTGVAEPVFHASNLLGTLVANTPFLENTIGGKIQSVPFIKKFAAIYQIAKTDPTTPEAAKELIEMSKIGLVPDRYASITFSKKAAEEMGSTQKKLSLAPILFGPKGIDIRSRLVMYRLAKSINPQATPQELYHFVNQLGNYVPALQSEMERAMKRTGFSPFVTAGTTMLKNGLNAWTGGGPMPKGGAGMRVWQQLTGGALFMIALWIWLYHEATGKWPWEDNRGKLMSIPAPDSVRRSKLGTALWGEGPETGYINLGFFNPHIMRGARGLGMPRAFEAANLHGNFGQQLEAAQTDIMDAFAQPFEGPAFKAAFVGATGQEPYVTGLRDRQGHVGLQLFPMIPTKTKPGWPTIGQRALAAAREINSFYGSATGAVGQSTGFLGEDQGKKGNQWVHMLTDYAFPGLVGSATNPNSKETMLRQQRTGTR